MAEEQLKAAETEATAQVEDTVEEISDDDLDGVADGMSFSERTIEVLFPI